MLISWAKKGHLGPLVYTPHNEVLGGYTGIGLSVRPSVRLSVRPSVCPSVDTFLSGLLLVQFSFNFVETLYVALWPWELAHLRFPLWSASFWMSYGPFCVWNVAGLLKKSNTIRWNGAGQIKKPNTIMWKVAGLFNKPKVACPSLVNVLPQFFHITKHRISHWIYNYFGTLGIAFKRHRCTTW